MSKYNKLKILKKSKSVCIIGHIDPDADALASMVVLKNFLHERFKIKIVDMFADCEIISKPCNELLKNFNINTQPNHYDTAIILDSPNIERIGKYKNLFESAETRIVIDHHITNKQFGNINLVENCSSTCEIIYSILKHFKYCISIEDQGKLYAGIITDTNNFTVGTFNKKTFKITSEFIDNINKEGIHKHFLKNNSLKQMKLLSLAINNLKSFNNDEIITSHLSKQDSILNNATAEDFTGIVNYLATISNSKLICFIYPKDDNYYVSMRANQNYDISEIAKNNGGGGHKGAAAFLSNESIPDIENKIIQEFYKLLNEITTSNTNLF